MIADKLGLEILQCGIDYYNDSDEPDCATKAMQLQEYALKVVVGKMAKDRCQENVDILKKIIAELPPAEVMDEHEAIHIALVTFATQPDLIKYSQRLIRTCASHIVAIKEKLGRDNKYYLKISTTVVNNALGNVIAEVNEAQAEEDFDVLKSTLVEAWRTQLYLDKFDVEPEFKDGRLKECRSALYGIIEQCKGFESENHSFMYRYGCGWCNNLDVADVDLRTDDEYFSSCRDLASYQDYLRKFPKGKHVSEAKSKIEELRYDKCKTIADYQKFINDYPKGKYVSGAKSKIEELRYKECKTISDYEKFINDYPNSAYKSKAQTALDKLQREEEERRKKIACDRRKNRRKKIIKWTCWIGIPILLILLIFLIWGIGGLAVTYAIFAAISGIAAVFLLFSEGGCISFIFAGIAVEFGCIAKELFWYWHISFLAVTCAIIAAISVIIAVILGIAEAFGNEDNFVYILICAGIAVAFGFLTFMF